MPLLISCSELEPGANLAEPLSIGGRRILAAGLTLTRQHIDALCEKFPRARVRVADPALDSRFQFQDDLRDREAAETIQRSVARFVTEYQQQFVANGNLNAGSVQASQVITDAAKYLRNNPVSAIVPELIDLPFPPLARHAARLVYFSLLLAGAARDYVHEERHRQSKATHLSSKVAGDLVPLGLGAMLADVAFFELGEAWARQSGHNHVEPDAISKHPLHGSEMLPLALPAGVKTIVRTHHEFCDGSGYPKSLRQENLHVFSRVVTICDAFVTALGESTAPPAQVLREMNDDRARRRFDPILLASFLKLVQPFAIGSRITVADGRSAVVVRYNQEDPLRPLIAIAFDATGRRLPDSQINDPTPLGNPPRAMSASLAAA